MEASAASPPKHLRDRRAKGKPKVLLFPTRLWYLQLQSTKHRIMEQQNGLAWKDLKLMATGEKGEGVKEQSMNLTQESPVVLGGSVGAWGTGIIEPGLQHRCGTGWSSCLQQLVCEPGTREVKQPQGRVQGAGIQAFLSWFGGNSLSPLQPHQSLSWRDRPKTASSLSSPYHLCFQLFDQAIQPTRGNSGNSSVLGELISLPI